MDYLTHINPLELAGLILGLLNVLLLIRKNILNWPVGIVYVLISLVIYAQERLYGDLVLHVYYLGMNIYGWVYWANTGQGTTSAAGTQEGKEDQRTKELPVTRLRKPNMIALLILTGIGTVIVGYILDHASVIFPGLPDAALPYWDSATSVISVAAMFLTARKKIESWVLWLIVDVLATWVYYVKGIQFYSLLYLVYIGFAVAGYLSWRKSLK